MLNEDILDRTAVKIAQVSRGSDALLVVRLFEAEQIARRAINDLRSKLEGFETDLEVNTAVNNAIADVLGAATDAFEDAWAEWRPTTFTM